MHIDLVVLLQSPFFWTGYFLIGFFLGIVRERTNQEIEKDRKKGPQNFWIFPAIFFFPWGCLTMILDYCGKWDEPEFFGTSKNSGVGYWVFIGIIWPITVVWSFFVSSIIVALLMVVLVMTGISAFFTSSIVSGISAKIKKIAGIR